MSYSRWGSSNIYSFHTVKSGDTKETQILEFWYNTEDEPRFSLTYPQVVDLLESNDFSSIPGYQEADRKEVVAILESFRADIDSDFHAPQTPIKV